MKVNLIALCVLTWFMSGCSRKEIYKIDDETYRVYKEISGRKKEIQALDLSGGNLNKVPLDSLSGLVFLDISNNDLEELPGSICGLQGLKALRLNDNSIKKYPECFFELPMLNWLSLLNCGDTIPRQVLRLPLDGLLISADELKESEWDFLNSDSINFRVITIYNDSY